MDCRHLIAGGCLCCVVSGVAGSGRWSRQLRVPRPYVTVGFDVRLFRGMFQMGVVWRVMGVVSIGMACTRRQSGSQSTGGGGGESCHDVLGRRSLD